MTNHIQLHKELLSVVCEDIGDMGDIMDPIRPDIVNRCWGNGIIEEVFEMPNEVGGDDSVSDNQITVHEPFQTQQECCICYDELQKTNVTTTPCGHSFCFRCIIKCLDRNNTCPYCRQVLREEEEESDEEESDEEDGDEEDGDEDMDDGLYSDWGDEFPFGIVSRTPFWYNTSNPVNTQVSVEEIHDELVNQNISLKDLLSISLLRYDDTHDYRRLLKIQDDLKEIVQTKDDERRREWEERQCFMGEDERRHNRTPVVIITIDRIGNRPAVARKTERPKLSLIHPDLLSK
jgi:hypothetical protein